jgi:hypothetical protein
MKKAYKRFRFCYYFLGWPLGKSIKIAIFGKDIFKMGG